MKKIVIVLSLLVIVFLGFFVYDSLTESKAEKMAKENGNLFSDSFHLHFVGINDEEKQITIEFKVRESATLFSKAVQFNDDMPIEHAFNTAYILSQKILDCDEYREYSVNFFYANTNQAQQINIKGIDTARNKIHVICTFIENKNVVKNISRFFPCANLVTISNCDYNISDLLLLENPTEINIFEMTKSEFDILKENYPDAKLSYPKE